MFFLSCLFYCRFGFRKARSRHMVPRLWQEWMSGFIRGLQKRWNCEEAEPMAIEDGQDEKKEKSKSSGKKKASSKANKGKGQKRSLEGPEQSSVANKKLKLSESKSAEYKMDANSGIYLNLNDEQSVCSCSRKHSASRYQGLVS
jgi:hypothetical protein